MTPPIIAALCGLGVVAGYIVGIMVTAWDKRVVVVRQDQVLVNKDVLTKLISVANLRQKNGSLKFDSRGQAVGLHDGVEEEDEG